MQKQKLQFQTPDVKEKQKKAAQSREQTPIIAANEEEEQQDISNAISLLQKAQQLNVVCRNILEQKQKQQLNISFQIMLFANLNLINLRLGMQKLLNLQKYFNTKNQLIFLFTKLGNSKKGNRSQELLQETKIKQLYSKSIIDPNTKTIIWTEYNKCKKVYKDILSNEARIQINLSIESIKIINRLERFILKIKKVQICLLRNRYEYGFTQIKQKYYKNLDSKYLLKTLKVSTIENLVKTLQNIKKTIIPVMKLDKTQTNFKKQIPSPEVILLSSPQMDNKGNSSTKNYKQRATDEQGDNIQTSSFQASPDNQVSKYAKKIKTLTNIMQKQQLPGKLSDKRMHSFLQYERGLTQIARIVENAQKREITGALENIIKKRDQQNMLKKILQNLQLIYEYRIKGPMQRTLKLWKQSVQDGQNNIKFFDKLKVYIRRKQKSFLQDSFWRIQMHKLQKDIKLQEQGTNQQFILNVGNILQKFINQKSKLFFIQMGLMQKAQQKKTENLCTLEQKRKKRLAGFAFNAIREYYQKTSRLGDKMKYLDTLFKRKLQKFAIELINFIVKRQLSIELGIFNLQKMRTRFNKRLVEEAYKKILNKYANAAQQKKYFGATEKITNYYRKMLSLGYQKINKFARKKKEKQINYKNAGIAILRATIQNNIKLQEAAFKQIKGYYLFLQKITEKFQNLQKIIFKKQHDQVQFAYDKRLMIYFRKALDKEEILKNLVINCEKLQSNTQKQGIKEFFWNFKMVSAHKTHKEEKGLERKARKFAEERSRKIQIEKKYVVLSSQLFELTKRFICKRQQEFLTKLFYENQRIKQCVNKLVDTIKKTNQSINKFGLIVGMNQIKEKNAAVILHESRNAYKAKELSTKLYKFICTQQHIRRSYTFSLLNDLFIFSLKREKALKQIFIVLDNQYQQRSRNFEKFALDQMWRLNTEKYQRCLATNNLIKTLEIIMVAQIKINLAFSFGRLRSYQQAIQKKQLKIIQGCSEIMKTLYYIFSFKRKNFLIDGLNEIKETVQSKKRAFEVNEMKSRSTKIIFRLIWNFYDKFDFKLKEFSYYKISQVASYNKIKYEQLLDRVGAAMSIIENRQKHIQDELRKQVNQLVSAFIKLKDFQRNQLSKNNEQQEELDINQGDLPDIQQQREELNYRPNSEDLDQEGMRQGLNKEGDSESEKNYYYQLPRPTSNLNANKSDHLNQGQNPKYLSSQLSTDRSSKTPTLAGVQNNYPDLINKLNQQKQLHSRNHSNQNQDFNDNLQQYDSQEQSASIQSNQQIYPQLQTQACDFSKLRSGISSAATQSPQYQSERSGKKQQTAYINQPDEIPIQLKRQRTMPYYNEQYQKNFDMHQEDQQFPRNQSQYDQSPNKQLGIHQNIQQQQNQLPYLNNPQQQYKYLQNNNNDQRQYQGQQFNQQNQQQKAEQQLKNNQYPAEYIQQHNSESNNELENYDSYPLQMDDLNYNQNIPTLSARPDELSLLSQNQQQPQISNNLSQPQKLIQFWNPEHPPIQEMQSEQSINNSRTPKMQQQFNQQSISQAPLYDENEDNEYQHNEQLQNNDNDDGQQNNCNPRQYNQQQTEFHPIKNNDNQLQNSQIKKNNCDLPSSYYDQQQKQIPNNLQGVEPAENNQQNEQVGSLYHQKSQQQNKISFLSNKSSPTPNIQDHPYFQEEDNMNLDYQQNNDDQLYMPQVHLENNQNDNKKMRSYPNYIKDYPDQKNINPLKQQDSGQYINTDPQRKVDFDIYELPIQQKQQGVNQIESKPDYKLISQANQNKNNNQLQQDKNQPRQSTLMDDDNSSQAQKIESNYNISLQNIQESQQDRYSGQCYQQNIRSQPSSENLQQGDSNKVSQDNNIWKNINKKKQQIEGLPLQNDMRENSQEQQEDFDMDLNEINEQNEFENNEAAESGQIESDNMNKLLNKALNVNQIKKKNTNQVNNQPQNYIPQNQQLPEQEIPNINQQKFESNRWQKLLQKYSDNNEDQFYKPSNQGKIKKNIQFVEQQQPNTNYQKNKNQEPQLDNINYYIPQSKLYQSSTASNQSDTNKRQFNDPFINSTTGQSDNQNLQTKQTSYINKQQVYPNINQFNKASNYSSSDQQENKLQQESDLDQIGENNNSDLLVHRQAIWERRIKQKQYFQQFNQYNKQNRDPELHISQVEDNIYKDMDDAFSDDNEDNLYPQVSQFKPQIKYDYQKEHNQEDLSQQRRFAYSQRQQPRKILQIEQDYPYLDNKQTTNYFETYQPINQNDENLYLSSRISYQHDQIKPKSLVSKDYLNINQQQQYIYDQSEKEYQTNRCQICGEFKDTDELTNISTWNDNLSTSHYIQNHKIVADNIPSKMLFAEIKQEIRQKEAERQKPRNILDVEMLDQELENIRSTYKKYQ